MDEKKNETTQGKDTPGRSRPPYRNLRVWVESFDLALDIFQMTRRLEGVEGRALTRRLIESSSRMPVAVARGQSSGSATEFIRCLHEGLSELSELETHLLICGELGHLSTDQVQRYEQRMLEIRKMTGGLIRRLRLSAHAGEHQKGPDDVESESLALSGVPADESRQRGSALLMVVLVSAVLGILGTVCLQIAATESRIAAQGRDRDQLLNVAETGARLVKAWFDQPVSGDPSSSATVRHALLSRFDLRNPIPFDRTRRLIDDGDPATAPVPADGSAGLEWYRQGREQFAGFPHLDLFGKPYRRGTALSFMGTEDGPDIVLEDQPGVVDLLDEIDAALFADQESTGRIEKIEIYAPQAAPSGFPGPGVAPSRLGIATVKVTAAKYRALDRTGPVPVVPRGARPEGRAVVRMGLAEIPTNAPRGPLEACGDITAPGPLRARWGRVQAVGNIMLADRLDRLDAFVASGFPYASFGRHIGGTVTSGDLGDWLGDPDDSIEDPWLKVAAGGQLTGWQSYPDQPLPYNRAIGIDLDHSNLFQRVAGMTCPTFDYDLWKGISQSIMPGDRYLHYYVFDPVSGLFREQGAGPARSVRDWTHGRSGIFFFDTADGARPGAGNLTPPVVISGGDWSTAGVIYLNAVSFQATSVRGVDRVLLPPGEPFDDVNHDLVAAPTETFVNLAYATSIGSGTSSDDMLKRSVASQVGSATSPDGETYVRSTTTQRDAKGTPILTQVNLFGVLFNSGNIVAEGNSVTYGSLVAGQSVTQSTLGAETPWIYFDERLITGEWPPAEIAMPRTYILYLQTSHP